MARIKSFRAPIQSSLLTGACFLWLSSSVYAQGGDMDSVWSEQPKTGSKSQSSDDVKPAPAGTNDSPGHSADTSSADKADSGSANDIQPTSGNDTTPPLSGVIETAPSAADTTRSQPDAAGTGERAKGRADTAKPRNKRVATTAPLCTVDSFARSALVSAGLWPGIGPFKVAEDSSSSQLVDDAHDTIKLRANKQKKVTGVEMQLTGRPAHDFLGLEMTSDFLLEALGTRPARIADFNTQLENLKTKVLNKGTGEQNLSAGRYLVYIKTSGKTGFNITVNNGEASADAIRDHSTGAAPQTSAEDENSNDNSSETRKRLADMLRRPTPTADATRAGDTGTGKPRNGQTLASADVSVSANPADSLKGTFQELIQNWQEIKKVAVKTRDTSELSKVLSGKALGIQTNGVKWLATNHKYYDMQPMGVDIGSCTELVKGKKYSVMAKVKELSKFYEETTNTLLRSQQDTYNVNYTVEKLGDHYVISDSAIVHFNSPALGGHTDAQAH
jgi:ARC6-like, IMS domain